MELTDGNLAAGIQINPGLPRLAEAAASGLGLIVTAPLMLISAAAVAVSSPGPVLFRQRRVGRGGRPFTLYKFRTMYVGREGAQVTAGGDARVTRVGRWLRRTKLDELPELWNVLRGDMSLVGPRPEVPKYVDLANPSWRHVLMARPGVTDPVTLRLRNEEELLAGVEGDRESFYLTTLQPFKLRGYAEYLRRRSWRSDLKILWETGLAVLIPGRAPAPTKEEVMADG